MRTWVFRLLAINLLASAAWFGWPFLKSPGAQALDRHDQLLALVAHRNWKQILPLLADDYRDSWEMSREEAISLGHELLQGFLTLDLGWKNSSVAVEGSVATVTGFIRAGGTGAGFSQEIIGRVNKLREPFVFTWRRDGWKPGDWRLVSVRQPELAEAHP